MNALVDSLVPGLLRASLILSVSAVLVGMCVRLLRVSAPRAEQCAWLCVLLQGLVVAPLLIPLPAGWSVAPPTSVAAEPPPMEITPTAFPTELPVLPPRTDHLSVETSGLTAGVESNVADRATLAPPPRGFVLPDWRSIAVICWGTGVVGLLLLGYRRYRRFIRRLQDIRDPAPAWNDEWSGVLREAGIARQVELRIADDVGPVLCRIHRRMLVVVPESLWVELTEEERIAVLRHEAEHIRRGDLWWSLVTRGLATLHWFNPCAWWAAANFEAQGEFACDQAAGAASRLKFADLLLRLGTGVRLQAVGVKAAASGRMYERIERLITGGAPAPRWRAAVPVVIAALIAGVAGLRFEAVQAVALAQVELSDSDGIKLGTDIKVRSGAAPQALLQLGTVPFPMGDFPMDIAFTPDSRQVAAAEANSQRPLIRLFDVATGREAGRLTDETSNAGTVYCFALSPDGTRVAGGSGGHLIVWGMQDKQVQFNEQVIDDRFTEVAFSPDGELIAVAASRGALQLRAAAEPGRVVRELQSGAPESSRFRSSSSIGASGTGSLVFTSDGARLISANRHSGTVFAWNAATGTLIYTFNAIPGENSIGGPALTSVALTPNGKSILTSGFSTVPIGETSLSFGPTQVRRPENRLWDLETGRSARHLRDEDEYGPGTAALFPDGKRLLTLLDDQLVIRDVDLNVLRRIPLEGMTSGGSLSLSPDGRYVAMQLMNGLGVFDTETGQRLHNDAQANTDDLTSVDWSEGGDRIATAGSDGNVRVWDAATADVLWSHPLAPYIAPAGHIARPEFVAFEPRFNKVIAAGARDHARAGRCGTVTVFDAATGQVQIDVTVRKEIRAGAVSPNGHVAVFAGTFGSSGDTQLYGVDLMTLKTRFVTPPDDATPGLQVVIAMEFLPDSSAFRVVTDQGQLLEVDAETGEQRSTLLLDPRPNEQSAPIGRKRRHFWGGDFSPDASMVVSSWEDRVCVWDATTGTRTLNFPHPHKHGCHPAISPDGHTIVTSDVLYGEDLGENTLRFYDMSGKLLTTADPGDSRATVLSFSPDSTKLFTGFTSQPPTIWGLE
jgi:WD40 repeat protein/beta-lactamase regulating signal transducer with metallopeptidase domain